MTSGLLPFGPLEAMMALCDVRACRAIEAGVERLFVAVSKRPLGGACAHVPLPSVVERQIKLPSKRDSAPFNASSLEPSARSVAYVTEHTSTTM